jgi:hypothetical protein
MVLEVGANAKYYVVSRHAKRPDNNIDAEIKAETVRDETI